MSAPLRTVVSQGSKRAVSNLSQPKNVQAKFTREMGPGYGASSASGSTKWRAANLIYTNLFRSNAAFVTTFVTVAMIAGPTWEYATDGVYNRWNQGKLYHQMIADYPGWPSNTVDEDEDEDEDEE